MTLKTAIADRKATSALLRITEQEAQVVDDLRRQAAAASRTDIARITGWSRPKVTTVINRMIECGLLIEVGEGDSQRGRRPRLLRLNGQLGYAIGVGVSATSIDLALADFNVFVAAERWEVMRHPSPVTTQKGAP